jgi:hypothetical protein
VDTGPERDVFKLPWRKALLNSATNTVNLVVAGCGAVAAAAMHSLPVLAMGGVAYLAMIAWDLASKEHWKRAVREGDAEEEKLPDPKSLADPTCKSALISLLNAKRELSQLLSRNPEQVNRYLSLILGSLSELEGRAARLINRAEEVSRYLGTVKEDTVRADMRRLDEQLKKTTDEDTRAQFQSARDAREQQLKTLQELVSARDRVYAHLSHIVATYEGLPSRVVHMRALDAQAMDVLSGDVNQELDRINREIGAFEETLKDYRVATRA